MTEFPCSDRAAILHGDCLEVMRELPDDSIDSIVTDPPYGLGFMGKGWDALPPGEPWARECLRVLKPGGHLLAFGGTRTWHRLAVAVEDAGFEMRDSIAWLYGSGFPKSLDVSKAIDKAAGATREVVGIDHRYVGMSEKAKRAQGGVAHEYSAGWVGDPSQITAPATDAARQWSGWGTALKPAFEPVVVARKPLQGTVAQNVQQWGTGALNIDACRIEPSDRAAYEAKCASVVGLDSNTNGAAYGEWTSERQDSASSQGRWPANVALDESQADALDQQSGIQRDGVAVNRNRQPGSEQTGWIGHNPSNVGRPDTGFGGSGGASRFMYVAKAPAKERPNVDGVAHPTVKPLTLMRWLCRLVTPPGGLILEPFAGSGTTVEAALLEGFQCFAIESEATYLPLIAARLARVEAAA